MNGTLTGGCQCGGVRYRIQGSIGNPHICHCRMCQKASGNYFLPLGWVKHDSFTLTRGEPNWFHSSDLVRRGFCTACGTPLFFEPVNAEGINIVLGSLDEPESAKPTLQSGQASRVSFFHNLSELPDEAQEVSADWLNAVARRTYQHPDHDTVKWPPEDE